MRHRHKTKILDRKKGPREMMIRNLAASVLMYEKVNTTRAKAKVVKPLVEKLITISKQGDLTSTKKLIQILPQKLAVKKLTEILRVKYKDRQGGYTRLVRLGFREGDGAEMARIELV